MTSASPDSDAAIEGAAERKIRRRAPRWAIGGAVLIALGWLAFRLAGPTLVVNEPWPQADAWLLVSGDDRFDLAIDAWRQGELPLILLVRGRPSRLDDPRSVVERPADASPSLPPTDAERFIDRQGLPADAHMTLPGFVIDETDIIAELGRWLAAHPQARVNVLCGRFDSRDMRRIIDQTLPPEAAARARVQALPYRDMPEDRWWETRAGVRRLMFAYLRLGYTILHGPSAVHEPLWRLDDYEQWLRGSEANQPAFQP